MGIATGAANALRDVPYPANLAAAASVFAYGAASILPQILASKFIGKISGQAHDGLDFVPNEGTYILNKGERILSPTQNKDLTEAIKAGDLGGSVHVENLYLSVAENAMNADRLLDLDKNDWTQIILDKIIPSMRGLKKQGVTV